MFKKVIFIVQAPSFLRLSSYSKLFSFFRLSSFLGHLWAHFHHYGCHFLLSIFFWMDNHDRSVSYSWTISLGQCLMPGQKQSTHTIATHHTHSHTTHRNTETHTHNQTRKRGSHNCNQQVMLCQLLSTDECVCTPIKTSVLICQAIKGMNMSS